MCPYFDEYNQCCKLYDTRQEGYQKETYCESSDNWTKCANYEEAKK